jgi:serine/threonine protein kinase
MEYVEGESLGQKLQREGRMPEAEAIRIIAQVAQGLHRAHKHNLIHRDVKPDNILIQPDGVAKLADLGLVKETETDLNLTKTGRGLGTPHFMAPEQFRNAKYADIRCDIYSLGATLYQMVTGELPFRSNGPLDAWMKKIQNDLTPPRRLVPTISERVEWAILRAMSADPEKRPASCREFIEDLTGHSTRRGANPESGAAPQEVWYLVYRDESGEVHTVKGNASAIRKSLKEGLLGDAQNVRASRLRSGPFEPLRDHAEFRDMVISPAPLGLPVSKPRVPDASAVAAPTQTQVRGATVSRSGSQTSTPKEPSVPHILHLQLDDPEPAGDSFLGEVVKWLFLLAIAVGSALLAFWFIPIP